MLKAPLTFRLYQSVKFNRPVDKETDYISPGGYEILVKDEAGNVRPVTFDFEDSEITVDDEDPYIVHCMQKNPDYGAFEDLNTLDEYMLRNIVGVTDWFIYTGDAKDGEHPLFPVEVTEPTFEIIPQDGEIFQIPLLARIRPGC